MACRPLVTNGLFPEDLIGPISREHRAVFSRTEKFGLILIESSVLSISYVGKPSWLHVAEVIIRGVDNQPIAFLWTQGVKNYSPLKTIHQFGRSEVPRPLISYDTVPLA